ncbi:putative RecB family nuclease [Thermobifida halotolerans]
MFSPTDLVDAMECGHRSALKHALAAGVDGAPAPEPLDALVARGGEAHEHAELQRLVDLFGDDVVVIDNPRPTHADLTAAAEATREAVLAGAPVVYQGVFYEPVRPGVAFHGRADFLISTAVDPATGRRRDVDAKVRHEPWDAKLAHRVRPGAVLQLAAYAEALGRTGLGEPEFMHLLTGDGRTHTLRVAEYLPLLPQVRHRLLLRIAESPALPAPLWGEPCAACDSCGYAALCAEGRARDRHLSLVAGIRGDQIAKLRDAGIATIDALACAREEDRPATLPRHSYARLREQAALQVRQDATRSPDNPTGTVIATVYADDGLAMLPEPSPGDVFFDMEGYPYHEGRGLEYLFGALTCDDGRFHAFWAHDRAQERRAFEAFVDFVCERIDAHEGAHVYHYASYEADRLKTLAAAFGTRETEVDELLRQRRLVDLYTVVKKSLRVSQRSYSIKYLEPLYLEQYRSGAVVTAASSIDAYAAHLGACEAGDTAEAERILADIAAYNRDDCVSTARLRDWLERLRVEHGVGARPVASAPVEDGDAERAAEAARRRAEVEERLSALTGPLLAGVPEEPRQRGVEERARALLAALVGYYRREEAPLWWDFFRRLAAPVEELEADTDCLVPLRVRAGEWNPPQGRQRKAWRRVELFADTGRPHPFTTGEQVRLLYPGPPGQAADTVPVTVEHASADRVAVVEKCDTGAEHDRRPLAVLPGSPVRSAPKDQALWEVAERAVAALPDTVTCAGLDVLRRVPPRLRGGGPLPDPRDFDGDAVAAVIAAVDRLDSSYLAVQGPPGAGKTYLAARLITHLVASGRSVGVCSTSHKAIENVLGAAVRAAAEAGVALPCAKRPADRPDPALAWHQPRQVRELVRWCAEQDGGFVVGGTAWNFANDSMRATPLDVLIVDEAGQFALADTLAVSASARDLVLLGDPQQLPQVVQGTHGEGADSSALEHLVGDTEIIDASRGYFLDQTRRMHPRVCEPVSRLAYRGRLHAHPVAARRHLEGIDAGLYRRVVAHSGRSTHSPEEVAAVVEVVSRLVGVDFCEPGAAPRPLTGGDVLVVAPFNLQVRALRAALADAGLEGVRVGTVDRFQGQEAPVVVCSMTVSGAVEAARGLDFVLSRNRLNVALSRAQVLAALVYSPDLVGAAPRSVAELRVLAGFADLCAQARDWQG